MKRILVTGATGFIGRYLCQTLRKNGYSAVGTYRKTLPSNAFSFVDWREIQDIGPATDWKAALSEVDCVVHLAALAHQIGKAIDPQLFSIVNEQGTRQLARAVAESNSVKRIIFVSSIGAICSTSSEVVTSETEPRPDTDYGRSKLAAEKGLRQTLASTRADWCVLRPTLVYGPENPGNMLRLIKLIKSGAPLPFGGIRNRRSFVFVGNVADAIIRAMDHPRASRAYFNVSDNEVLSTPELIERLARHSGKQAHLFALPKAALQAGAKFGDIVKKITGRSIGLDSYSVDRLLGSLEVDNSYIRKTLDWNPPFSAEQGFGITFNN